jgi:hypothetical protein
MRSLWRMLALRWLGGKGSEALTGDSGILEGLLLGAQGRPMRTFDVRPEPQVSPRAIMLPDPEQPFEPEIRSEEALRSGASGRYSR